MPQRINRLNSDIFIKHNSEPTGQTFLFPQFDLEVGLRTDDRTIRKGINNQRFSGPQFEVRVNPGQYLANKI